MTHPSKKLVLRAKRNRRRLGTSENVFIPVGRKPAKAHWDKYAKVIVEGQNLRHNLGQKLLELGQD